MGITRIDHLYAETIHWEQSVEFPRTRRIGVADPDGRIHPLEEVS